MEHDLLVRGRLRSRHDCVTSTEGAGRQFPLPTTSLLKLNSLTSNLNLLLNSLQPCALNRTHDTSFPDPAVVNITSKDTIRYDAIQEFNVDGGLES